MDAHDRVFHAVVGTATLALCVVAPEVVVVCAAAKGISLVVDGVKPIHHTKKFAKKTWNKVF